MVAIGFLGSSGVRACIGWMKKKPEPAPEKYVFEKLDDGTARWAYRPSFTREGSHPLLEITGLVEKARRSIPYAEREMVFTRREPELSDSCDFELKVDSVALPLAPHPSGLPGGVLAASHLETLSEAHQITWSACHIVFRLTDEVNQLHMLTNVVVLDARPSQAW